MADITYRQISNQDTTSRQQHRLNLEEAGNSKLSLVPPKECISRLTKQDETNDQPASSSATPIRERQCSRPSFFTKFRRIFKKNKTLNDKEFTNYNFRILLLFSGFLEIPEVAKLIEHKKTKKSHNDKKNSKKDIFEAKIEQMKHINIFDPKTGRINFEIIKVILKDDITFTALARASLL